MHGLYLMKWRLVWLQDPPYDAGSFAKIVTRDASKEGGSAPACASNVRQVRHRFWTHWKHSEFMGTECTGMDCSGLQWNDNGVLILMAVRCSVSQAKPAMHTSLPMRMQPKGDSHSSG